MELLLSTHFSTFDPFKYSGAWYEVASYKDGFYGLSCMDTRSLYEYNPDTDEMDAVSQCRRLDKRVSSVRGVLSCPTSKSQRGLTECTLRFPDAPYVPPATYRILETDYSSYTIVEGAGDKSFIQIYSRYPRPGMRFIEDKKRLLRNWGYDPDRVHVTPITIESDASDV